MSASKYLAPQSHANPPKRTVIETATKPSCKVQWPAMSPMINGEMASPKAWMMKIFTAKALARIAGCVTLARMVLVGPVLKYRQKTLKKTKSHAQGNGVQSTNKIIGKASNIDNPETTK